jgi:energy-coupling factor transport system permease protein
MAFDIVLGQYHHADSIIHRLDPRVKITLMIALFVTAFLANGIPGLLVMLALVLGVIALSTVALKTVAKALAPLAFLLIFPLFFNLFFITVGTPLFSWGAILITDHGVHQACFMTLRLFILFLSATLLTLTTSPIVLSNAIASMLAPFTRFGLPAYEISMMVNIALRFLPTLLEDFDHIRKAQLARGATLSQGGPIKRVKLLLPLLVPLFAQSLRHAEGLAVAMESRCYHGGTNRTHYRVFKIRRADICAIVVCAALLLVMILWL